MLRNSFKFLSLVLAASLTVAPISAIGWGNSNSSRLGLAGLAVVTVGLVGVMAYNYFYKSVQKPKQESTEVNVPDAFDNPSLYTAQTDAQGHDRDVFVLKEGSNINPNESQAENNQKAQEESGQSPIVTQEEKKKLYDFISNDENSKLNDEIEAIIAKFQDSELKEKIDSLFAKKAIKVANLDTKKIRKISLEVQLKINALFTKIQNKLELQLPHSNHHNEGNPSEDNLQMQEDIKERSEALTRVARENAARKAVSEARMRQLATEKYKKDRAEREAAKKAQESNKLAQEKENQEKAEKERIARNNTRIQNNRHNNQTKIN